MGKQRWLSSLLVLLATSVGCGDTGDNTVDQPCPSGLTDCDGVCVDTEYDPDNCGACSTTCGTDLFCSQSSCAFECVGGTTECGTTCVDTGVDENNCGACGVTCDSDEMCAEGACFLCDGGMEECNDACVDPLSDNRNCGGCGVTCNSGESCLQGTCSDIAPVGAFVTSSYYGTVRQDLVIAYDSDTDSNTARVNTVSFGTQTVTDFELLDNGSIIFRAAQDTEGVQELYLAPAGSGSPVKLSSALAAETTIIDFVVSEDQTRFVYRSRDIQGRVALYTGDVAMQGVAIQVNGPIAAGGTIYNGYVISSDNSRIAYLADNDASNRTRIFAVEVQAGFAIPVADDPVINSTIVEIALSDNGGTLVFRTAAAELIAVDLASPSVRTRLGDLERVEDIFDVSNNRVIYMRSRSGQREIFGNVPLLVNFR